MLLHPKGPIDYNTSIHIDTRMDLKHYPECDANLRDSTWRNSSWVYKVLLRIVTGRDDKLLTVLVLMQMKRLAERATNGLYLCIVVAMGVAMGRRRRKTP